MAMESCTLTVRLLSAAAVRLHTLILAASILKEQAAPYVLTLIGIPCERATAKLKACVLCRLRQATIVNTGSEFIDRTCLSVSFRPMISGTIHQKKLRLLKKKVKVIIVLLTFQLSTH